MTGEGDGVQITNAVKISQVEIKRIKRIKVGRSISKEQKDCLKEYKI
jgi:hypothetical protein